MVETNKINMIAGLFTAFAFEKLSVTNSVTSLTASKYGDKVKRAVITVETAQIRYKYNGDDPTTTEGHISQPQDVITIRGTQNIQNFRAIRTGSTSANLHITYEY